MTLQLDDFVGTVRKLLDELHAHSAAGLITREALVLIGQAEILTRKAERDLADRPGEYDRALVDIEKYFDEEPIPGTPEAARFDALAALIESHEAEDMDDQPDENHPDRSGGVATAAKELASRTLIAGAGIGTCEADDIA